MGDRTPTTQTVVTGWAKGHPFPLTTDVDERYAEFCRWLEEEIRKAKADAWGEGLELAVDTLRAHQDGDQFGGPVTVKDMAAYIPTAINPYRGEGNHD